jgi:hypothetical protein
MSNQPKLSDHLKNIIKSFIDENDINLDVEVVINLMINQEPKKQFNRLFQKYSIWKKNKTKISYLIVGDNKPLPLKLFIKSYLGVLDLGYDIKPLMKIFIADLKNDVKENALKVIKLLKQILVDLKIKWEDIHQEQFGYSPTTKKIVAIDLGVKGDTNVTPFTKNVHRVSIKGKTRTEINEGGDSSNIDTINFFDFDNTLMFTYGPELGKKKYKKITGKEWDKKGWVGHPESIMSELETPRNDSVYRIYEKFKSMPNTYNVLLSNRVFKLENEVVNVLNDNNIHMDEIQLKMGNASKSKRISSVFEKFPEVTTINVFDDLITELNSIEDDFKALYSIWREDLTVNLYLVEGGKVSLV